MGTNNKIINKINNKYYIDSYTNTNYNILYYVIDFILNTKLIKIDSIDYFNLKKTYNKIKILDNKIFKILYYDLYNILSTIYIKYDLKNNNEFNYYIKKRIVFEKIKNNGIYFKNKISIPTINLNINSVGRVSFKLGKLNLMNIKKDSDLRKLFGSRFENGLLYQFDYDAFHPRIIMNFFNNNIPTDKLGHKYLCSLNLNKSYETISKEEINEFKLKFFKFIYGEQKIEEGLFVLINNNKLNILKNKTILNRQQDAVEKNAFNYFILKNEIDIIIYVLDKLFNYIENNNLNTKIFMYQYDALFFDIPKNEEQYIEKFKNIMELDNKFRVNIKKSENFIF